MIDINKKYYDIYNDIKVYLEEKSKYSPKVLTYVNQQANPLVVVSNNSNMVESRSCDDMRSYQVRQLEFEIDIFAKNINDIASNMICDELSQLVIELMQGIYNMEGGIEAKLINIDSSSRSKYILHFSCKWFINKDIIY